MVRFPIFLAALAFAGPAIAFDGLWRDFAVITADETSDLPAFNYVAPQRPLDPRDGLWPANPAIAGEIFQPHMPEKTAGVDFGKVTGVFEAGFPPDQIYILDGEPAFAALAPGVLLNRRFTSSIIEGVEVMSKGDDNKTDFANRNEDPFSGALGRAYRLSLSGKYIAVTHSTPLMQQALAALAESDSCTTCVPWRAMLDAVRAAAGADATLVAASGYPVGGLAVSPGDVDVPLANLPRYSFAMFTVTSGSGPDLHLSLHFADGEAAQAGAKNVGNGIQALLDEVDEAESPIFGGEATVAVDGPVVTVSVAFPHPVGANLGYNRWIQLVLSRRFAAIAPAS